MRINPGQSLVSVRVAIVTVVLAHLQGHALTQTCLFYKAYEEEDDALCAIRQTHVQSKVTVNILIIQMTPTTLNAKSALKQHDGGLGLEVLYELWCPISY